ncbi:MAG: HAD family phosphatase [Candidatus Paceibacterota bacterium]|jgi:putative hydrolase of the HAD superfamily
MIKAVIFDLNGIFIQSPKLSDRFEKDFKIPVSEFLSRLSDILSKVRQPGAGPAFLFWRPVLEKWGVSLSEQEFWDYWFKTEISSEKMINFAKSLREKGVKVFILSNNFKERSEYYEHYPWIHEVVDKVYFSWQTGFRKPDKRAWELVLSENNLKPEDCIYFDDQQKNLDSAEGLGIKSFLFTNEIELEKTIKEEFWG